MKKLILKAAFNRTLSPVTGWTRHHWEESFQALMKGIVDSAQPSRAAGR
jgi:hypothetical protein